MFCEFAYKFNWAWYFVIWKIINFLNLISLIDSLFGLSVFLPRHIPWSKLACFIQVIKLVGIEFVKLFCNIHEILSLITSTSTLFFCQLTSLDAYWFCWSSAVVLIFVKLAFLFSVLSACFIFHLFGGCLSHYSIAVRHSTKAILIKENI